MRLFSVFRVMGCALAALRIILLPAMAQTTAGQFQALAWDDRFAGKPLDLAAFHPTFNDDFNPIDVTADGGAGPWYAPVHGSFGAASFLPPGALGPFILSEGHLVIRAEKQDGRWQSGLMQTVDGRGHGFSQQYGYFEMTARFPAGPGGWPAFWLLSQNGLTGRTATRTEIDVVEWYGGDPKGHHASVHLWPAAAPVPGAITKHILHSSYHKLTPYLTQGRLDGFHRYGAEITPQWVIIYFDRRELTRFKTLPEFQTPLYMLVDLAIFPKEVDVAESPKEMGIENVSAYAPK
jgi:beta-glucanase (GH16 family)